MVEEKKERVGGGGEKRRLIPLTQVESRRECVYENNEILINKNTKRTTDLKN